MRAEFIEINERLADWYDRVIAQQSMQDYVKQNSEPVGLKERG